jgi:hypothetical protein
MLRRVKNANFHKHFFKGHLSMTKTLMIVSLLAGTMTFSSPAKDIKDDAVMLKIDYSGKKQCDYAVDYTSQGSFKQKDSLSSKSTAVRCIVRGAMEKPDRLAVKVDSVEIKSDVYNDDVKNDLREKLLKSEYSISLASGFPSIDTSAKMLAAGYLQWDLYRQLAKLLPILPKRPVKPGFTWERTFSIVLPTARGSVPCEVYRFYTFKKLQGDTAIVSWDFRYTASEKKAADSADVLNRIPVAGKGSGSAILDVRNRCILRAEMEFAAPVAVVGEVSVTWKEKAVFSLINCQ